MRRLLILYGAAITSVVVISLLVPLAALMRSMAEDHATGLAHQEAQSVAVVAAGAEDERLRAVVRSVNTASSRRTTIFMPDGSVIGVPSRRTPSVNLAAKGRAFTANVSGGREVLLPVSGPNGVLVVRSFVPTALLRAGWLRAMITLGTVGIVLLTLAIFAAERIATRVSRSVRDLAAVANQLAGGDFKARVDPAGPPEVVLVGRVLNRLGDRISQLLAGEREIVADLSHRLRTPITALRLDADGLTMPEERTRMAQHVADLEASVDTLIRVARQPGRPASQHRCDAAGVVAERARFWSVLAEEQYRWLRTELPNGPCPVPLDESRLGAVLDALVDNVFAHTREGVPFTLSVRRCRNGRVVVAVDDAGGGIADPTLALRGRSGAGSTGLGLDVARRDAENAGGRLIIERSRSGGARVALELPCA
ncbi:MAG TPA: HAMP domain-containing sensor histidine kinase [Actinopolymorphaceae bacterium]|nr:HAMP domain-containing sensor histidine kinase [Actinopolymorphaceae bacterium]